MSENPLPKQHSQIHTIILPTMPQPDTIVAIFLLKKFGEELFPGVKTASIKLLANSTDADDAFQKEQEGHLFIDVGGGRFDHHGKKTTASFLVSEALGISADPALAKMLEYARRDDMFGKGTISEDPIDRAFGLSSLVYHLNRSLAKKPDRVVEIVLPLLVAHYNEEYRRTHDLPQELEQIIAAGKFVSFTVKQDGSKKLKVVFIHSDNPSMAGFLRSQDGGGIDVVAQRSTGGHVNILTRPTKHIDLRALASFIRLHEADMSGRKLNLPISELVRPGRIADIPEWYYDHATNSIQNGGANPQSVAPTKISDEQFQKILKLGLSYKTPYAVFSDADGAPSPKREKDTNDAGVEEYEYFLEIRLPQDSAKEISAHIAVEEPGVKLHRSENFHIPLLHLGRHTEADMREIIRAVRNVLRRFDPFDIRLDNTSFSEGPIAGYENGKAFYFTIDNMRSVDVLSGLQEAVRFALSDARMAFRDQEFKPHLTVGSVASNINPDVAEKASMRVSPFTVVIPVKKIRLTEVRKTSFGVSYRARTYFPLGIQEDDNNA